MGSALHTNPIDHVLYTAMWALLHYVLVFNTQLGVIQKEKNQRVTCGQEAPSDSSSPHTTWHGFWYFVWLPRLALSVRVSYAIFHFISLHCTILMQQPKPNIQTHNTDTPNLPTSHLPTTPTNLWHTTQHTNLIYLWHLIDLILCVSLKIST